MYGKLKTNKVYTLKVINIYRLNSKIGCITKNNGIGNHKPDKKLLKIRTMLTFKFNQRKSITTRFNIKKNSFHISGSIAILRHLNIQMKENKKTFSRLSILV